MVILGYEWRSWAARKSTVVALWFSLVTSEFVKVPRYKAFRHPKAKMVLPSCLSGHAKGDAGCRRSFRVGSLI
jgi:hypothetical protein